MVAWMMNQTPWGDAIFQSSLCFQCKIMSHNQQRSSWANTATRWRVSAITLRKGDEALKSELFLFNCAKKDSTCWGFNLRSETCGEEPKPSEPSRSSNKILTLFQKTLCSFSFDDVILEALFNGSYDDLCSVSFVIICKGEVFYPRSYKVQMHFNTRNWA